jgi:hypothetical protein
LGELQYISGNKAMRILEAYAYGLETQRDIEQHEPRHSYNKCNSKENSMPPFSAQTIEGHFGRLETDRPIYQPLDRVYLRITGRAGGDTRCAIRICDPLQREYLRVEVDLVDNQAEVTLPVAGFTGVHYIYLHFPGEKSWSRYVNIDVQCESSVQTGDPDFDELYPYTRDHVRLGRREYQTPRGKFVGYISADTWHFDGIWLRDWVYGLPGFRHWERDMPCGIDRFLEAQNEAGMIPDGIERDGRTWRVGLESDVEYIMTLAVWQTWQVSGDDAWLRANLPHLERALVYIRSDPKHWDAQHQLIKRQHSCDTWDYDIDGASDHGDRRHVIATCDQSGYYQAFQAMGQMYAALGESEKAQQWQTYAEDYRQRASALLWDGGKFLHHFHLDPIEHGDFDETQQLAMGNTWAVTRGMATPDQARSVVDEYRRRQADTGDAYPWWSLQPGYPNHLNYFKNDFTQQGGYANGGLMPWVGGELCRGALQNGRERYGVELLRQYADHLRRTGGAQVWYWTDGQPGFRTTNEVRYAGWGMAQWACALFEGLAGVRDQSSLLRRVEVSPRWAAAGVKQARVSFAYAASPACFCYSLKIDEDSRQIALEFTGSGEQVEFSILLPEGWEASSVLVNGKEQPFQTRSEDGSRYISFSVLLAGVSNALVTCH